MPLPQARPVRGRRHVLGAVHAVPQPVEKTIEVYRNAAQLLAEPARVDGAVGWPDVTRTHVEQLMAWLLAERSAGYAHNVCGSLKQLMKWLVEEDEIPADPMARLRPPIVGVHSHRTHRYDQRNGRGTVQGQYDARFV